MGLRVLQHPSDLDPLLGDEFNRTLNLTMDWNLSLECGEEQWEVSNDNSNDNSTIGEELSDEDWASIEHYR